MGRPSRYKLDDLVLHGGGPLDDSERRRLHRTVVEPRGIVEAERRVPGRELLRTLEEARDLAVLGVGGTPYQVLGANFGAVAVTTA